MYIKYCSSSASLTLPKLRSPNLSWKLEVAVNTSGSRPFISLQLLLIEHEVLKFWGYELYVIILPLKKKEIVQHLDTERNKLCQ